MRSQGIKKLIDATIETTGRGQTIDIETLFDETEGLTIRVISPETPIISRSNDPQRPIGSPDQDGLLRVLPLIRAIVEAHGGNVASCQEGPRKFVTMILLPKDGPTRPA